jgi:preflagellin peptidase FlaK
VRRVVPLLDLLRLFVGATLLAFAAYTDWRWRRAPNVLWVVMAAVGLVALAAQLAFDPQDAVGPGRWPYLAAIPLFAAAMYAMWWFGLIAGGADAKALMALALLVPFPLALAEGVPPFAGPLPGAFTVLGDSLLLFLVIPLSFAVWNLAHGDARFPHLFLGLKRKAKDVRRGHAWPMEVVNEDGTRRTRLMASRMSDEEIEQTFERVQALGDEKVWVSPKVPFMVPLLLGFVAAFLVGDLLLALLRLALPAPA